MGLMSPLIVAFVFLAAVVKVAWQLGTDVVLLLFAVIFNLFIDINGWTRTGPPR